MKALLTIFLFLPLVSFAQFRVFENLDQLQNGGHGVSDEVVFVKGYATAGDGGEGFFMYDPNATKVFGGMFIAPTTEEEGRRVNFFCANGSDDLNDTASIQKEIDFAHENGFPQILIPKGTYLIDSLTIKKGTKIKGTIIKSIAKAERWYEDNNPLIKIDDNAVTDDLSGILTFNGNRHNKVCFLFEAKRKDDIHAGLCKSSFKNIKTAIRGSRFSRGIAIERNRFTNASGFERTSRDYILYVEGKSNVTFERNVIVGKYSGLTISEPGSVLFKLNNFPNTAN